MDLDQRSGMIAFDVVLNDDIYLEIPVLAGKSVSDSPPHLRGCAGVRIVDQGDLALAKNKIGITGRPLQDVPVVCPNVQSSVPAQ